MKSEYIVGIILVVLVIVGLAYVLTREVPDNSLSEETTAYPEYEEIQNPAGFLNTGGEEITIGQYIGEKVILLDFLTYSCVNCIRTFPYLNDWYEKYEDDGLIIIGIHTPEFAFERDIENVRKALEKEDIEFPVVLDNDYATWRAYGNKYWPRKYLIDINGKIVYDHIGEGAYEETEAKIVELLSDLNNKEVEKQGSNIESQVDFSQVRTRETYLGSARVEYINNLPAQTCLTSSCEYAVPSTIPQNSFSLSGTWRLESEFAELESGTGSIFLRFSADKVHLVAAGGARAELYLDSERVTALNAGEDAPGGVVTFFEEDFYNLIDLEGNPGEHVLEIRILDAGFQGFAFTFG